MRKDIYSWQGRFLLHLEEFWVLYVWVGLVLASVILGIIGCDGNAQCLNELFNSIH